MYRKHAKELPKKRPKWLPKWIWRELSENFKAMEMYENDMHEISAAEKEYYDYYQYLEDYYNDELYDEVEQTSPKLSAAFQDDMGEMYDYYEDDQYDDEYDDEEYYDEEADDIDEEDNDISLDNLQDQWVDEEDGSAWIVSADYVNENEMDFDWENDQVFTMFLLMHCSPMSLLI